MLKLKCSTITLESVLQTSGHVKRFTDVMVKVSFQLQCILLYIFINFLYLQIFLLVFLLLNIKSILLFFLILWSLLQDSVTGECFRADHLIKSEFEGKIGDKKTSDEEKNILQDKLNTLENMTLVNLHLIFLLFDN